MRDTLDTLAAKAEALECMRIRGDKTYPEALTLFNEERTAWVKQMQIEVLTMCEPQLETLHRDLKIILD